MSENKRTNDDESQPIADAKKPCLEVSAKRTRDDEPTANAIDAKKPCVERPLKSECTLKFPDCIDNLPMDLFLSHLHPNDRDDLEKFIDWHRGGCVENQRPKHDLFGDFILVPKCKTFSFLSLDEDDTDDVFVPWRVYYYVETKKIRSLDEFFLCLNAFAYVGINGLDLPCMFVDFIMEFCDSLPKEKIFMQMYYCVIYQYIRFRIGTSYHTCYIEKMFESRLIKAINTHFGKPIINPRDHFKSLKWPEQIMCIVSFKDIDYTCRMLCLIMEADPKRFIWLIEEYPNILKQVVEQEKEHQICGHMRLSNMCSRTCNIEVFDLLKDHFDNPFDVEAIYSVCSKAPTHEQHRFSRHVMNKLNINFKHVSYHRALEMCIKSRRFTFIVHYLVHRRSHIDSLEQNYAYYDFTRDSKSKVQETIDTLVHILSRPGWSINILDALFPSLLLQDSIYYVGTMNTILNTCSLDTIKKFTPKQLNMERLLTNFVKLNEVIPRYTDVCKLIDVFGCKGIMRSDYYLLRLMITSGGDLSAIMRIIETPDFKSLPSEQKRYYNMIHMASLSAPNMIDTLPLFMWCIRMGKNVLMNDVEIATTCSNPKEFNHQAFQYLWRHFKDRGHIQWHNARGYAHIKIRQFIMRMTQKDYKHKLQYLNADTIRAMEDIRRALKNPATKIPEPLFTKILQEAEPGLLAFINATEN